MGETATDNSEVERGEGEAVPTMSSLAVEGTLMSMVEQILPSLVREKTFDFNAVAAEIEGEFGLVMTVDEIRLAFAKSELKNSSLQGEDEYEEEEAVRNEDSSEESEEEDYSSYPDRFGRRSRPKRTQEPNEQPSSSSWLSFDENQQETKEEKITHEDESIHGSSNNYQAPSGSTNVRVTSNATAEIPTNDDSVPDLTLSLPSASVMESLIAELATEKGLSTTNGGDKSASSNEPKSEMQQVLEILAQPDDPGMDQKASMQDLFGISEDEFNRQVMQVQQEHEEQERIEMEKEKAEKRRIAEEKSRLSAERTTEASLKKSLNDEKIRKVFDRVVEVLGVDDDVTKDGAD